MLNIVCIYLNNQNTKFEFQLNKNSIHKNAKTKILDGFVQQNVMPVVHVSINNIKI